MPISPSATAPPSLTPTPPAPVAIGAINLIREEEEGTWVVLGTVENLGEISLNDLRLSVTLLGSDGAEIASLEILPALTSIAPGASAPFQARFESQDPSPHARAEAAGYRPGEAPGIRIVASALHPALSPDGLQVVLGTLTNLEEFPLLVSELHVLASSSDGLPWELAPVTAGPSLIEPGARVPFAARLTGTAGAVQFTPFFVARRQAEPAGPIALSFSQAATLRFDPQSRPFVVGEIENAGQIPLGVRVLVGLMVRGDWLALSQLETAVPLQPGERRGFTAWEWLSVGADPNTLSGEEEVRIGVWTEKIESQGPPGEQVALRLRVISFRLEDGFMHISGIVSNPFSSAVDDPSVHAAIWAEGGQLLTAGWTLLSGPLEPAQEAEFSLSIPQPAGLQLAAIEYDLRASGLVR